MLTKLYRAIKGRGNNMNKKEFKNNREDMVRGPNYMFSERSGCIQS